MELTLWYIIIGLTLISMALAGDLIDRLPLSASMLYLGLGVLLGPWGLGMIHLDPIKSAALLEGVSELAVIVSLFVAGLKLSTPLSDRRWWLPVRLASVSMALTVGLVTLIGVWLLRLPVGAAVLLGAIIAPTDPVLASEVRVDHPRDRDRLRFGLTGEAGLNDGTAFPFVMLGLGLLGVRELGPAGWRWWTIDVLWALSGGLAVGAIAGWTIGTLAVRLRHRHGKVVALADYLSLGLLAATYGLALLAQTYGFLAAFAAGLALRRVESSTAPRAPAGAPAAGEEAEIDPQKVPAQIVGSVLSFTEQLERIAEVGLILLIGGVLAAVQLPREAIWFVPLVLLVVRPLAVLPALTRSGADWPQRGLICWFGIRGVGSIYYLMYALTHGVPQEQAELLTGLTLSLVAASIVVHGISATPLMKLYQRGRASG